MTIIVPADPAPASGKPALRRFGADLTPPLGGPVQRLSRLGARFFVEIRYDPMDATLAGPILAALMKADVASDELRVAFPQAEFSEVIGAPLVAGAGQAGSLLNVDGLLAGVTVPQGVVFSFEKSGRAYLHMTTESVTANGSGQATLTIAPMLRTAPPDNAALEFANPKVEGLLQGGDIAWDVDLVRHLGLTFSIFEAR